MNDLVTHNDVVIKAAPASIWPYILDPSAWKTTITLVSIGGEPGQLGERFKAVLPDEPQDVLYYIENVEIVPQRRRTVRLNAPDRTLIGFAGWQLTPQNASTLVEYNVYCQGALTADSAMESLVDQAGAKTNYHNVNYQRFAEELAILKKLVEGGRRSSRY